ncbi:MAG: hypothetical protein JO195_03185 [Candidatus Eremiobacteraeota bacterium]|nr:hypothetical protein [Candidatus Eremiobacteraeota bacterium]
MTARTTFLAKLIGLYFVLSAIAMLVQRDATAQVMTALVHDAQLTYVVGVLALLGGLAIVLNHNVWSGGALPVLVTIIGWVTLLKGLLSLFLPADSMVALYTAAHYDQYTPIYAGIVLIIGAYLTYGGFARR